MLIGGLAVSSWGEARATLDVDLTIWVDLQDVDSIVSRICSRLTELPKEPVPFVRRTRVLPIVSQSNIRVDLIFAIFAALHDEKHMIDRAQPKPIAGTVVMVPSVEDLLYMKLASERPKDLEDCRALLRRFGRTLDRDYLEPRIRVLAEGLARPDILTIYHDEVGEPGDARA